MLELLIIFPLVAALLTLILSNTFLGRFLLICTAIIHSLLTAIILSKLATGDILSGFAGLLSPDMLGGIFLGIASGLFLMASIYAVGYLKTEVDLGEHRNEINSRKKFTNAPERRFIACLCIFLAAMTLVVCTRHLGALWVGIEITTLASAPLIYFHRHQESLEATWKYLIICSVGIALALLGNLLLSLAFAEYDLSEINNSMDQLNAFIHLAQNINSTSQSMPWLKAAFIFFLVGYGTKMGLAPLHNWLPDAHSQAPSLVSALLSGALLNCALLGILRGHQVMIAAKLESFSSTLLIFFGLISLITAAIFIIDQGHYKRLLAYSSVEHMGIIAFAIGLGGPAIKGALLHTICHSMTKAMLFLLAGNILSRFHSLSSYDVRGMSKVMPLTTILWTAGFFAIVGSPPFGLFVSEFWILKGALIQGQFIYAGIYLLCLTIIFIGMSIPVLRMVQGSKTPDMRNSEPEPILTIISPLILGLGVLFLGLYIPQGLIDVLKNAALSIGG